MLVLLYNKQPTASGDQFDKMDNLFDKKLYHLCYDMPKAVMIEMMVIDLNFSSF